MPVCMQPTAAAFSIGNVKPVTPKISRFAFKSVGFATRVVRHAMRLRIISTISAAETAIALFGFAANTTRLTI